MSWDHALCNLSMLVIPSLCCVSRCVMVSLRVHCTHRDWSAILWDSAPASESCLSSSVKISVREFSVGLRYPVCSLQLGYRGVVWVQQDVRAGHAAPADPVPADLRQPHADRAAVPLPAPGETRHNQHLPAQDLQRVADQDRVDLSK